jgi:hypothetical protein
MELTVWRGPYSHEGGDRQPESSWVDLKAVAEDHPGLLQPLNALGHGRGRHADAPSQGGHGDTGVGVQFAQEAHVGVVEKHDRFGEGRCGYLPWFCRQCDQDTFR